MNITRRMRPKMSYLQILDEPHPIYVALKWLEMKQLPTDAGVL